jgi:hypothetical protein
VHIPSLHPRLNGRTWVSSIGPFGDVSYSENWLHGCESATWSMRQRSRHRDLHPGATVQLFDSGQVVWTGVLDEPGRDGTMRAAGWWTLGQGVHAAGSDGVTATTNPFVATRYALYPTRGGDAGGRSAVPWYAYPQYPSGVDSTLNASFGDANSGDLYLTTLLDRYSEGTNRKWRIDHTGYLATEAAPTTPKWGVLDHEGLSTWSREEYVTHLNVTYLAAGGVFTRIQRTTPETTAAAARFGRQERPLDLTWYGILTLGQAQAYADSVLADTGNRMTYAEPVTLQPGQLQTFGGSHAGWAGVHAGQMVRLWGVVNRGVAATGYAAHTDIVIDRLERTASTLMLAPPNLPPRNVSEVIAKMTQDAA